LFSHAISDGTLIAFFVAGGGGFGGMGMAVREGGRDDAADNVTRISFTRATDESGKILAPRKIKPPPT
jgi:hypothetical protein